MTMSYHIRQHNGQLSKPRNHFVCHLQPWECSFHMWSILSWITHRNSYLECTYLDLQVWYKLLHNFWCKRCFFNFSPYSFTSLLFFPNFDIKSFNDSHTVHFINIEPLFLASTLKWCFFFNLLIINYKIPPMFNSLLIYKNLIQKQWSN